MDKDTLIILQAITEGIAAVCKTLQKIEPKVADEETNLEVNNEETTEEDE
ncbi:hypothetical protein KKG05_04490 [bacterium]|nr:hypothetical protein [bacterium]